MRISERGSGLTSKQLLSANQQFENGFIFVIHPISAKGYYFDLIKSLGIHIDTVTLKSIGFINSRNFIGTNIPVVVDHYVYDQAIYNIDSFRSMIAHNHRVINNIHEDKK